MRARGNYAVAAVPCAAVCPGPRPQARAEDGEWRELPFTAFNSPPSPPCHPPPSPPSLRALYHNVTTRDSLALLLKVKIPVGAGAILRRTSLQASSSSHPPLSRLSLPLPLFPFPLFPTRSIYVLLFFFFSCKLVQTFIGAILCVHNGRW